MNLGKQPATPAGTVQYSYNGDGSLDYRLDAKGQKVKYTYDSFGRTTVIDFYPAGQQTPDLCQRVSFTWDTSDWQYRPYMDTNTVGRIAQAYYGCGFTERYLYTSSGKVTAKQLVKGGGMLPPTLQAQFKYDYQGRLTSYLAPFNVNAQLPFTGYRQNYTSDALGRQTALQTQVSPPAPDPPYNVNTVTNATYKAAGQMLTMTAAGYNEKRYYNTNLQLTRISAPGKLDLQYTYGSGAGTPTNGRLWKEADLMDGQETTYSYDALNRLIGASATAPSAWTESYNYDGFGNLYQLVRNGQNSLNVTIDGTAKIQHEITERLCGCPSP